MNWQYT